MNADIAAELRRVKARIAAFNAQPAVAECDAPAKLRRISDREVRTATVPGPTRFIRPSPGAHYKRFSDN